MPNGGDPPVQRHPIAPQPWLYTHRFIEAVQAALLVHAHQPRKGTTIPYASHLLGTCSIALDYGANEDEAIAALLHDAIEDVHYAPGAWEAVEGFGPEVLRIVEACSDTDTIPKPPWAERKKAYLAHLGEADRAVLLVSASDKLHNARSIVADLRRDGDAVWERFNATKAESLGYYRALVVAFRANPQHAADLVDELDRTVSQMEALAGGVR
jgi:GTP pyrophosphokinase